MTPDELKLAKELFTILPTITIAVSLAVGYVKWKNVKQKDEQRILNLEKITLDNKSNIAELAKIHLHRHPDDAGKFIKKELISK